MMNTFAIRSVVASTALGLMLALAGSPAAAGEACGGKSQPACEPTCGGKGQPTCEPECGGKGQPACPPACDPKTEICDLCHNIGGPRALGANCDAGNCNLVDIVATGDADLIAGYVNAVAACNQIPGCDPANIYGGIVVPFGDSAFNAHYNHGDGLTLVVIDPTAHDSQPLQHVGSNVGCFAVRHDPDPGN